MRLAVVVLAGKTSHEDGTVRITVAELGRWLGLSADRARKVLRGLQGVGIIDKVTKPGEFGQDGCLSVTVRPLAAARGALGDPLALSKKELAVLLALLEAVMAPGWLHRDGSVTPAGLIVEERPCGRTKRGRSACTDRLALLLLVLEANPSGRVRLRGGAVDSRGRPAATVAQLLGCTSSGGEKVLRRLEDAGVVTRRRRESARLRGKSRLLVPAVAAAHRGTPTAAESAGRCGRPTPGSARGLAQAGDCDPATAPGPGETSMPAADDQARASVGAELPGDSDPAAAPVLHAEHSPVAGKSIEGCVEEGFSGAAAYGPGDLPERAPAREDQVNAEPGSGVYVELAYRGHSPLRGDKLDDPAITRTTVANTQSAADSPSSSGTVADCRSAAGQVTRRRLRERSPRPPDDLAWVFGPVRYLWEQLGRGGARATVVAAARRELKLLAGVGDQLDLTAARQLLADRLHRRWQQQREPVNDPVGWFLARGLPRRATCRDVRCDDGKRLDTGQACPACQRDIDSRRGDRRRLVEEVTAALPDAPPETRRAAYGQRLRQFAAEQLAAEQERREQAAAERQVREQEAARLREQTAAAEAGRRAWPCSGCGRAEVAGWCTRCEQQRACRQAVEAAAVTAAAAWAVLDDPADVDAIVEHTAAEVCAAVEQQQSAAREQGAVPETLAVLAKLVAQSAADDWKRAAVERLQNTEESVREGERAYAAAMRNAHLRRSRDTAFQEAHTAAAGARRRVAEHLLNKRVGAVLQTQGRVRMADAAAHVADGTPVVPCAAGSVEPASPAAAGGGSEVYARGAAQVRAAMRSEKALCQGT